MQIEWIVIYLLSIAGALVSGQEEELKVFDWQPQQVHIAFGENVNDIVVTWSTMDDVGNNGTTVEYGIDELTFSANGTAKKFVDGGTAHRAQYIHRVVLKDLTPQKRYFYHCGSKLGWSPMFYFQVPRTDSDWSPHVAIFGDMGNEKAVALPRLQEEAQKQMYDAMIHNGDFAYDMHNDDGKVGDQFMRQIEPVAAYVPYMVSPGNHEQAYNFSHYRARFSMPQDTENLWYSFNLGPVHFIGFSTEFYYFLNYGIKSLIQQYEWLKSDLIEANKPENRKVRPWIITYGHRPMYCSNNNTNDCTHFETSVRVGLPFTHLFGLEPLFYKYGVDVEIWAHEHDYERLWPLYDHKVKNGSYEEPYKNPGAPVHIITGSAGCKEGHNAFLRNIPSWSAFHSQHFGTTRMKAYNRTHLYFEQVSDDRNEAVIDSFYVVKDIRGPYEGADDIQV